MQISFIRMLEHIFDKMKDLPLAMMKMGKFIEKANGDFKESDQSFSKELETEVDEEYEQNSNNGH